jgi:hypothetical protein
MRSQLIVGYILSCCVYASNASGQVDYVPKSHNEIAKKPFSAVLVEYRKDRSSVKTRTRIYSSAKGIRTERLGDSSEIPIIVVIKNYSINKIWLVNPVKKFFAEMPKDGASEAKRSASEDNKRESLGVLSNKPCLGMRSEKQSVRSVGDTELSVWHCLDSHDKQHLQHFSTLLGVVIRQESQDGHVSELQDIALIDDSNKYFEPSSDMQQISLEELVTGRLVLPKFVD